MRSKKLKSGILPQAMPSKKSHIKLYADECFPVPSATYLKSLGYSAIHAYEKKLIRKPDRTHLAESKKLNRVLITLDRDFIYYKRVNLIGYPGVIVLSLGSATFINVNKICSKLFKILKDDFVKDAVLIVSNNKMSKIKGGKVVYERRL